MQLSELRTQTRYYLADPNGKRWGNTELDTYINMGCEHYYNKLVNVAYDGLLASPVQLSIVSGTNTVALPTDFLKGKILYAFYPSGASGAISKVPCVFKENFDNRQAITGVSGFYRPNYSFIGTNLLLDPVPYQTISNYLELIYFPVMAKMVNDTDTPPSGFVSSWHQLIPLQAALIAKSLKEEEDVVNVINLISIREQPFNTALDAMTIARRSVEPFNTSGYSY